jgi:hypothetical protein
MGKRTSIESEQQPKGKEIRLPAKSTITTFNSEFCDAQESIDEANEGLKKAAEEAKAKHLDIWAFKICQKLYSGVKNAKNEALAAEKLAIKLAQFDKMREHFKLDELANLQSRMFAEGEMGSGTNPPRKTDEDGEPDMRPNHLRQPGASAAEAVKDLAAKTGAKTSTDPIDNVGRGPSPKLN